MNTKAFFALGLIAAAAAATAQDAASEPQQLERVTVRGERVSTLPTAIPTTIEGISAERIDALINATDSADALKYFPSLLVRKRYIGDYDHAVLSTRASGT
ncbi:MAG: TonB-dependent receptor, partial [Inhella sp.]